MKHTTETTRLLDSETLAEEAAVQAFESAITDADVEGEDEDVRWQREQRLHHKSLYWYAKPTVGFACVLNFLFFIGSMCHLASYVGLTLNKACVYEQSRDASVQCSDAKVQATITSIEAKVTLVTGLIAVVAGGKICGMSDRVGRKPLIIFATFIGMLARVGQLLLVQPATPFRPWLFVLNGAVAGVGGNMMVMISLMSSYITDIVEPHARTAMLGFTIGSFYAGVGIGPLIGSLIVRKTGLPENTLWFALVVHILVCLIAVFLFPESRHEKLINRSQSVHLQRRASIISQRSLEVVPWTTTYIMDPLNSFIESMSIVKCLWLPKHSAVGFKPRYNVLILAFVELSLVCVMMLLGGPTVMYAIYKFHASPEALGYYIASVGISKTLILYCFSPLLLHLLKKKLKTHISSPDWIDWIVTMIATSFDLMAPLVIIYATSGTMVFASSSIASLGAMATPTIQAAIMKYYPESKSGELFGALAVLKSILVMIGPAGGLFVYSHTVSFFPTAVFYVAAAVVFTALVLLQFVQLHEDVDIAFFEKKRASSVCNSTGELSLGDTDADTDAVLLPPPGSEVMAAYSTTRRASTSSPRSPGF